MFDKCAYCIYAEEIGYDYDIYVCTLKSCIYGEKKEQTSKSNKLIDEEKLDKLAEESWNNLRKFASAPHVAEAWNDYIHGFKAGYRKAKEG